MLALYPADSAARNNLALAFFSMRNFDKAREEGRRALEIYPNRLLYRSNYALYGMYAGEFDAASEEAARIVEEVPSYYPGYLPMAIGALSRFDFFAAERAYSRQAEAGQVGASLAAMGLADLAIYRGRFEEAVDILTAGILKDEAAGNEVSIAGKYVALAEAYQGSHNVAPALDAVARALELRRREEVLLPAARVFIWAKRLDEAQELASELESELRAQPRGYGKIIRGELALEQARTVEALEAFESAQELVDTWLVRFELGRLYVGAGRYAEALAELELCERRAGEAAAIFLDDVPTYRYLAPLPYWLGRAREGLGMKAAAADNYETFLTLRMADSADTLAADARHRREALRN